MEENLDSKIIELYNKGTSLRDIAAMLHIDHYTVWQCFVRNKLDDKPTSDKRSDMYRTRPQRISDEVRLQVGMLYEQGEKWTSIKSKTGVSRSTIEKIIDELGIVRKRASNVISMRNQHVVELRKKGLSYDRIMEQTGLNRGVIYSILASNGCVRHWGRSRFTVDQPNEKNTLPPESEQPEQPSQQPEDAISDKERAVVEARHALELAETRLEIAKLEAQLSDARAHLESLQ